jgi:hypothetical protein
MDLRRMQTLREAPFGELSADLAVSSAALVFRSPIVPRISRRPIAADFQNAGVHDAARTAAAGLRGPSGRCDR